MIEKNKVILVDWGIFMFRSIFCWKNNRNVPPTYTTLSMLISCLKTIGCHPDDLIIIAIDSPLGSWRRDIDFQYKANRKANREKHKDINWTEMFTMFKDLLIKLKEATPFIQIVIDKLEADDIIAASCRFYKDKDVIIVSGDSDYEMLAQYSNVKVFSPKAKKYKYIPNPTAILASKIKKETADNLISPLVTEEDYKRREMLVNLLKLPDNIEDQVINRLSNIEVNNNFNITCLPFGEMRRRFMDIYGEGLIKDEIKEIEPKIRKKKPLIQKILTL